MASTQAKNVVVLGSTGSVGTSTLQVARGLRERVRVAGLSAGSQWRELAEQVREFRPRAVAVADPAGREGLQSALEDVDVRVLSGEEGVCELAALPEADIVVNAITGWAGLAPAMRALECGRVLALANKESLVVGGELLRRAAEDSGGVILPVDSEQSAVMQALRAGAREEVARVVITASGGPFLDASPRELARVTPEQALQHPTWRMGKKITIDSATMMNKALEIVETRWLFDLDPARIDVLIHPQCVIHSLVEFVDGTVMAQLGVPDMKLPIQFALTYPDRVPGPVQRLDLAAASPLELRPADPHTFPALALGYEVARRGGTSGAVLNAANEVAVAAFLARRLRFDQIVPLVASILHRHRVQEHPDMEALVEADRWAREEARRCLPAP